MPLLARADRLRSAQATNRRAALRVSPLAAAALASLLVSPLLARSAQVTARQGPVDTSKRFTSPMILEAPLPVLPGFKRTQFGKEIADYACDDVSLRELSYQVTGNRKDAGKPATLDFQGWVVVPNSFDREVDVVITVMNGAEKLGSRGAFRIDAEEGGRTPFRVKVAIPRLDSFTGPSAAPKVQITVTVRDNS